MTSRLNLEQLRKQAKERLRERRAVGEEIRLAEVQRDLARELGFASWPKLKIYVERLDLEQPFRTDLDYYEGRASGIASTTGLSIAGRTASRAPRRDSSLRRAVVARPSSRCRASGRARCGPRGHREVAELLGREPANLRVAAGLGDVGLIHELAGTPQAGAHRGFYRPHGGFPVWEPSDDPQEVLDEALVWAAKSDCVEAFPVLVGLGARVDADPYRGTALAWAAVNGRVRSVRMLVELGADPNHRGSFGGPSHGEGVTAIHLAAQAGRRDTVVALLDLGADLLIVDRLHGGTALGWARFGGHGELSEVLP